MGRATNSLRCSTVTAPLKGFAHASPAAADKDPERTLLPRSVPTVRGMPEGPAFVTDDVTFLHLASDSKSRLGPIAKLICPPSTMPMALVGCFQMLDGNPDPPVETPYSN